jgi:hypothetical protein
MALLDFREQGLMKIFLRLLFIHFGGANTEVFSFLKKRIANGKSDKKK